jgi:ArsR family transcriptional regulator
MDISAEQFFSALSNEVRLRCLVLLQHEGELCVCELTHALNAAQPKISRHLAHLREWGIVLDRREGLWIHYRLHPELPEWAQAVLATTTTALITQPPYAGDLATLQSMPNRPGSACCA